MRGRKKRSKSISSGAEITERLSFASSPQAASRNNVESSRDITHKDLANTIASYNAVSSVQSDIQHVGWISDPLPHSNVLHHLPPILVFIRGWLYLHEAWQIWKKDSRYAQISEDGRKVRLLTALTGGMVAVGGSIVSLLMALHVGLLATALAVTIAPVILSSVSIAFFCMTLFRDLYQISEINMKLAFIDAHERSNDLAFIQELRTALIAEKKDVFKNIFFGSIGTAATIAFLIVMAVPSFGLCWIAAAALTAIAVSPAIVSLGKKILGLISGLFSDKPADVIPPRNEAGTELRQRRSLSPVDTLSLDPVSKHPQPVLYEKNDHAYFDHRRHLPEAGHPADEKDQEVERKYPNGSNGL